MTVLTSTKRWLEDSFPDEDREAWAVVAVVLVVLFSVQYLGFLSKLDWFDWLGFEWLDNLRRGPNAHFVDKVYFAVSRIAIYAAIPIVFAKRVLKKSASELGWSLTLTRSSIVTYGGLYLAVLPFVWWASTHDTFNNFYPFFRPEGYDPAWRFFAVWEALYFLYFLAFEFFFRGFVLQALRPRFGTMAVAFMLIPYVMIHFRKPFLEAVGAIIAGVVLGVLAYRSRNAFPGALLHFAVALTMDLLAVEGL